MQGSDGLRAAIYRVVWYAAALHVLTLLALLAAGMLFAVDDLETILVVVLGISVLIWGQTALILIPIWLISLVRRPWKATPAEPLHDPWLDE